MIPKPKPVAGTIWSTCGIGGGERAEHEDPSRGVSETASLLQAGFEVACSCFKMCEVGVGWVGHYSLRQMKLWGHHLCTFSPPRIRAEVRSLRDFMRFARRCQHFMHFRSPEIQSVRDPSGGHGSAPRSVVEATPHAVKRLLRAPDTSGAA